MPTRGTTMTFRKFMDPRKCIFLVAGLLILEISSPVDACSCLPSVLQNSYCDPNTIVLKVKILEPSQKKDGAKGFKVEILTVLKGDQKWKKETFIDSMSGTTCEYYFNTNGFNVEYLAIASIENGVLIMSSCSYSSRWTALTSGQTKGVGGAYQEGCTCKIVPCFSKPCPSPEPKTCILEQYDGGDGKNQRENQVCVPKTGTECIWKTIE